MHLLSWDTKADAAKNYLALASNSLQEVSSRQNKRNVSEIARKKMEEAGKNTHKEWIKKIKENIANLDIKPQT